MVSRAKEIIATQNLDHEYLSQDGHAEFVKCSQKLLFGEDSPVLKEQRIFSIQGISGTGSLRLATEFIKQNLPGRECIIPVVSWPNHEQIFKACGIKLGTYRYLDNSGCRLDFEGLIEDLRNTPEGTIVLLHSCAHNPSGVDPSQEQWKQILDIIIQKKLFPFFDNAYQGFLSGYPDVDAYSVRLFVEAGLEMIVACSYAKNFGLYGERIGCLHFVFTSPEPVLAVGSQLRAISRTLYSTCPAYGARIVAAILSDPVLTQQWKDECKMMADRLNGVRQRLYDSLIAKNVKGTWNHITAQKVGLLHVYTTCSIYITCHMCICTNML